MLRRSARRWGPALICPSAFPPGQRLGRGRPKVGNPPRLADLRRQDPGLQGHDAHAQPERLAQLRLDRPRLDRPRELDLELDFVHRGRIAVERDAELADALELAQDLLDRRREHVHPADDDHVVAASEDALRQPAAGVAGAAVDRGRLDDVAGPVADHGEAGASERGQDELAGRGVGHRRAGVGVEDLGDELVLAQVHAAAARARVGERADLREAGVVEAARAPADLDLAPHRRDRPAGLAGAHDALDGAERLAEVVLLGDAREVDGVRRRAEQRRGAVVADRLQALQRVHAAERDHHRADVLRALVGGPELDVGAERVGERDAVVGADAGGAEHDPDVAPPPRPVLRRVEDAQGRAARAARLVQVRVVLEREGQVRPERRVGRLVGDEVVLRGERQRRDRVEAVERDEAAQALALERVRLGDPLEQRVEAPEALGVPRDGDGHGRLGHHAAHSTASAHTGPMSENGRWQTVDLRVEDGIAWVTLNRPDKRNAMNPALNAEMIEVLETIDADDTAAVLVLTGAGDAFSAGMDLKEYFREVDAAPDHVQRKVRRDSMLWQWRMLRVYPKPTIAMVNGWCFGGAFTPLVSCDLAVAADDATFGLSEVNWGIPPGGNVSRALAETVGTRDALLHIMTGRTFDGRRAAEMGLVNESVPRERLHDEVRELARELLGKSPAVLGAAKVGFKVALGMSWEQAEDYFYAKLDQSTFTDREGGRAEGLTQFLDDKRFRPGLGNYARD